MAFPFRYRENERSKNQSTLRCSTNIPERQVDKLILSILEKHLYFHKMNRTDLPAWWLFLGGYHRTLRAIEDSVLEGLQNLLGHLGDFTQSAAQVVEGINLDRAG